MDAISYALLYLAFSAVGSLAIGQFFRAGLSRRDDQESQP